MHRSGSIFSTSPPASCAHNPNSAVLLTEICVSMAPTSTASAFIFAKGSSDPVGANQEGHNPLQTSCSQSGWSISKWLSQTALASSCLVAHWYMFKNSLETSKQRLFDGPLGDNLMCTCPRPNSDKVEDSYLTLESTRVPEFRVDGTLGVRSWTTTDFVVLASWSLHRLSCLFRRCLCCSCSSIFSSFG